MKKLSDSTIFTKLINNSELILKMKSIASENGLNILTPSELQNEFSSIDRRINYSTKGPIMDKIKKGNIKMFADEKLKLPTYLSTVPGVGINGDVVIYTNLTRYMTKTGEIYPKTLFAILQNSLINYEL